ncbi:MAG: nucleotidyl transferase AbiEii/AbiGii toxin family protein [Candidatus Firestonebacteria bacterium]|nr:nucleotidyl transferase AbiEii/AbiGii toxin family protein [Candidatus Firestonebacteria bacterium]
MKDIYTDVTISSALGFKGGTCVYFFYGLQRFSVDLDFDLLLNNGKNQKIVFRKIENILEKYGIIKDKYIKRYTIFMLLSYGNEDHNIKIEISTRETSFPIRNNYILKKYLGISMLVAKKDYLFASKLAALTLRSETAMRDVYDIYFFAKNSWEINEEVLMAFTGKTITEHLADCIAVVQKIKDNQILQGLGEVLNENEKLWVKKNLRSEVLFMLNNYISVI